jgi:hypothetical protein
MYYAISLASDSGEKRRVRGKLANHSSGIEEDFDICVRVVTHMLRELMGVQIFHVNIPVFGILFYLLAFPICLRLETNLTFNIQNDIFV